MDWIWLYGVECQVRVGVPAAERRRPQKILIDVGLELDLSACAAKDDFRLTADYWGVEKAVREAAETGERRLVETLAEQVAGGTPIFLAGQRQFIEVPAHPAGGEDEGLRERAL